MRPLVSIIMPAYNAEPFIGEAVRSVLDQAYTNWELLVVNDGSTDGTTRVLATFSDSRIRVFHKVNGGIGSARNMALDHVRGSLLCTLDADDVFPPESLASRVALLAEQPGLDIADGVVKTWNKDLTSLHRVFHPSYKGQPLGELLQLKSSCYFGSSWMIRWNPAEPLRYNTSISHAEDLLFYMQFSAGRTYGFVEETILHYRVTGHSTMSNLSGLGRSYRHIGEWLKQHPEVASPAQARIFNQRWRSIMFRTWLKNRRPLAALRVLLS